MQPERPHLKLIQLLWDCKQEAMNLKGRPDYTQGARLALSDAQANIEAAISRLETGIAWRKTRLPRISNNAREEKPTQTAFPGGSLATDKSDQHYMG